MLPRFFIDRPNFALVIAIITVLVGAIASRLVPIAQFPDITPPQIQVIAYYPGASASLIQKVVASPIEEQVNGVDNMIYMSSISSSEGVYTLSIIFNIGTDPDIAEVQVENRVALAEPDLPDAVTLLGIETQRRSSNMLQVINLISPNNTHDQLFLSNYATNVVQDPLSRISGVGDVSQFGPLDYSMRVWLNPEKMAALNLDASDVATAIEAQNIEAAPGYVGAPPFGNLQTDFQFTLETNGLLETAEDFENIILSAETDGSYVRLKDVARVELASEDYNISSSYNGKPSAIFAIFEESNANAIQVADAVRDRMVDLAKQFPEDLEYVFAYDVTTAVRVSIREIFETLLLTSVLVISVTFFFLLSWRATIIPAIAIPVSLLGTLALIYLIGFSANMITLFAFVLAITLVVDDAIVIIENTERIMEEEDLDAREATLKAMTQVTRPIIATTFVLAAVFVPVCFFPGITGELYLQFALTITVAFLLSAVNALTLSPVLCSKLLSRGSGRPKGILKAIPSGVDKVRDLYVACVKLLLRVPIISVVLFAAVLVGAVYLFKTTPTGFIPQEDNGILFVNVELPEGASLQRTEAVLAKIDAEIRDHKGVSAVTTIAGYSILAYARSNVGMVILLLDPWGERTTPDTQWRAIMQSLNVKLAAMPDATSFVFPLPSIPGIGSAGGLTGELLDEENGSITDFDAVKNAFVAALRKEPEFESAFSGFSANAPQYFVEIDRDRAEALEVSVYDIIVALEATFSSVYVNNFVKDDRVYWVVISTEPEYRQKISDIDGVYVNNSDGDSLPLRTFITVSPTLGAEIIYRFNLYTSADVTAQFNPGVSSGEAIQKFIEVAEANLPKGYGYAWTGITLQEVLASGLVTLILVLAVVFAYLFMVALYESWILPISVMASTVFAIFGALIPLQFVPGLSNDIYVQIGIVLLIGLAAKKAIMVVEFAKNYHEAGYTPYEAAVKAAHIRFRPVTMTGLCFIFGVVPLLLSSGAGAAGRISIGYPVFFGMIIDSTLGLLMIPVLFVWIQNLSDRLLGRRTPPSGEQGSAKAS
ncbi:efflux RND transporter permease subunit [Roseibium sp. RKSG952]|uniref:efflux RND transporter permease subunit n=1 Tax=Roseibium sp. RKSG952 TaxID=2529384 RepID=UPI0012BB717C|nr:efflux RND transporter permease subunit [Roseibium sp. RKSG952]MTH98082.1 efflux RND transporter permease subunit [Roseibium sp. RKSG952]